MTTIQKFNLAPPVRTMILELPVGSKFLTIHTRDKWEPCLFFEADHNLRKEKHEILMAKTDDERPPYFYKYLGTAVFEDNLVLHIYML